MSYYGELERKSVIDSAWRDNLHRDLFPSVKCSILHSEATFTDCCESPLELKFIITLELVVRLHFGTEINACLSENLFFQEEGAVCRVFPQYPWNQYRSDFAFRFNDFKKPPILIECDGHDFHNVTKTQIEYDRQRDCAAQIAGYSILRFPGSRIQREPVGCVYDVLELAFAMRKDVA